MSHLQIKSSHLLCYVNERGKEEWSIHSSQTLQITAVLSVCTRACASSVESAEQRESSHRQRLDSYVTVTTTTVPVPSWQPARETTTHTTQRRAVAPQHNPAQLSYLTGACVVHTPPPFSLFSSHFYFSLFCSHVVSRRILLSFCVQKRFS